MPSTVTELERRLGELTERVALLETEVEGLTAALRARGTRLDYLAGRVTEVEAQVQAVAVNTAPSEAGDPPPLELGA